MVSTLAHNSSRIAKTCQLGSQLDRVFRSMTLTILDETSLVPGQLSNCSDKVYYQGAYYQLVETFEPRHRLQAYCAAQHLAERGLTYVMTASDFRFALWQAL